MHLPSLFRRHRWWILIFLLIAVYCGWSLLFWRGSFDSDEAVLALAAKHMKDGTAFTPYFWGVNYGGTLQSLVAVPFLWIFGDTVIAIRISVITCMLAFYLMHAIWTQHVFGKATAMLSTLIMAFPGYSIYQFMVRFSCRWHMYLALWMAFLLLFTFYPQQRSRQRWALIASGTLMGLMFWTQPLTLLYMAGIAGIWLLSSPEWQRLRAGITRFFQRLTGFSGDIPFAIAGGALVLVSPFLLWSGLSMMLIKIAGVGMVAAFLWSRRKLMLVNNLLLLGTGCVIGNFPQWGSWIFWGIKPSISYTPWFPTARTLEQFINYVPSTFIGMRTIPEYIRGIRPWYELPVGITIGIVILIAIGMFAWRHRQIFCDALLFRPIERKNAFIVLLGLLWVLPWIAILGQSASGEGSVRFLAGTWQAQGMMVALLCVSLWKYKRAISGMLCVLWILHFGVISFRHTHYFWKDPRFSANDVTDIETFLQEQNAAVGYADFWHAYVLDFLTEERLQLSNFDGGSRYVPYEDALTQSATHAFILRNYVHIPLAETTIPALMNGLAKTYPTSPALQSVAHQRIVTRKQIGNWDVWILTNNL